MKNTGFTLIELIIVLALIGILSLMAYPSYNEYLIKVRRTHIAMVLVDLAGQMERYYLLKNTYDGAEKLLQDNSSSKYHYNIKIKTKHSVYTLEAIPIDKQAKDFACGALIIDQDGNKNVSGSEDPMKCWLE